MEDARAPGEPGGSTTRPLPGADGAAGSLLPDAPLHRPRVGQPPAGQAAPVPGGAGGPAPGAAGRPTEPDPPNRWFGLLVIAVSQLLIVLDATVVNVALPAMAVDLEISEVDRQWVVTAYTLAFGGLLMLGGRIADYVGRRRTFLFGSLGFALASGAGGLAQNTETLLAARAGQGVFGALLAPAALALVTTMFHDPAERAKAFAVFGAVAGGGAAIGLVLGGVLTEWASWRWTMFINVPIALATIVGGLILLPESRESHRGRIDVVGAVLATAGLLSVVYSFSEAERKGWAERSTLAFLGAGLLLLVMFVVSQRIVANPLLPLRVLADRTRAGANIAVLLGMVGMFGVFFFLSFYMQGVLGFKPVKTGVAFLPVTGGIIVSSAIVSNIAPKVPPRLLMSGGLLGTTASLLLLVRISPDSSYAPDLLPALFLMGFSLGAVFVPAFNAATIGVAPEDAGVASAAVNTAQQVGGSLGLALLSTVAADHASAWLATQPLSETSVIQAQVEGYSRATLWAALIVAAAAVITLLLVNVRRLELPGHGEVGPPPAPGLAPSEFPPVAVPSPAYAQAAAAPVPVPPGPRVPPPLLAGGPDRLTDPPVDWPPPPVRPVPVAAAAALAEWPPGPDGSTGHEAAPAAPDRPERPVVWPLPAEGPPKAANAAAPAEVEDGSPGNLPYAGAHAVMVAADAGPSPAVPAAEEAEQARTSGPTGEPGAAPAAGSGTEVTVERPERPVVWPPRDAPVEAAGPPAGTAAGAPNGLPAPSGPVPAGPAVRGRVRGTTGAGVAGTALTVLDSAGRQVGRGTSATDGGFAFPLPGPGDYVLVARRAGHRPQAVNVSVPAGPAAAEGVATDIVLTGSAALAGTVRATGTGSPIRGALVTLADPAGDVVASTRTDDHGDYEIPELTNGTFTLVVTTPSCRPVALLVELAGEGRTRQDVEVAGSATLHGVARTPEGRPVPDARVSLTNAAGETVAVTVTDAGGRYAFEELDEGPYVLSAVGYPLVTTGVDLLAGGAAAQEITMGHPPEGTDRA